MLKAYLTIGILLVQLVSLFVDRNVPYFPIEISRTAASFHASWTLVFVVSLVPLILAKWHWHNLDYTKYMAIVAVNGIAWFDDVKYYEIHMISVILLLTSGILAFGLNRHLKQVQNSVPKVLFVFILRIALKIGVVWFLEMQSGLTIPDPSQGAAIIKRINYEGCINCLYPKTTLLAFRLAGLLQWVLFYYLYDMYNF